MWLLVEASRFDPADASVSLAKQQLGSSAFVTRMQRQGVCNARTKRHRQPHIYWSKRPVEFIPISTGFRYM